MSKINRLFLLTCAIFSAALLVGLGWLSLSSPVGAQNNSQNAITLKPIVLLKTATATGPLLQWPGGQGICQVWGTFGAGTVTLQNLSPDGTTLLTVGAGCTFTAAGEGIFNMPAGLIQATVTGATGASLSAAVTPVIYVIVPAAR